MHIDVSALSDESRVYIFPSNRKFYLKEVPQIEKRALEFCDTLDLVKIGYKLLYDRFLIFFVSDSTPLTIEQNDKLSHFILALEDELEVQLMDKVNVCFKQGEFVQRKEVSEFKKLIKNRSVSGKTIVFDPTINSKMEFDSIWERPASESWLGHLF